MTLRAHQDAFGRALYDAVNGGGPLEIVERDDGDIEAGAGPAYIQPITNWPGKRYVRGRVIDVGCGAGRHALALQKQGFDVTGIDVSPWAIKAAKQLGLRRARVMSITQMSRSLGTFDTIQMLGNNFGLFADFDRARRLLRRFHHMTSDRGRIIAQSLDVYQTKEKVHLDYQARNRRRGRMSGQIRLRFRYRTLATPWFDYLMVSRPEMKRILAGTGWHVRRFIGTGASYTAVIEKD